jgi:S1-C subfamily serine protease
MTRCVAVIVFLAGLATAEDHALLVGCTEYPNLKNNRFYATSIRLFGPGNDVVLLRDTLVKYVGVPEANITVLKEWPADEQARPTRANILHHLERLAREAKQGDRVIVHLAGHGSVQPDKSNDELDGLDEIFLPADVIGWQGKRGEVENAIPDDELGVKLRAIRDAGAKVWLLMDCCHAGTMVRAPLDEIRSRRLDPELLGVPPVPGKGGVEASPLHSDLKDIVAMYGSQSHRMAPEVKLPPRAKDRQWHGLFSYMVAAQLRRTGGHVTFRELLARVIAAYQALPFHGTIPVAEGDLALRVSGERSQLPPLFLKSDGEKLVLNAGRLAAIGRGTVLSVHEPGGKKRLGFVEVAEPGLERSVCRPVKRDGLALPALKDGPFPAVVVSASLGDFRLKLAVPAGPVPDEAAECFKTMQRKLDVCADPSAANWVLAAHEDGTFVLRPARSGGVAREFAVAAGGLEAALNLLFRAENLKRLAGGGQVAGLPPGLRVELVRGGKPVEPGGVLRPGDEISLLVQNTTGHRYDVTVLLLDAHYNVIEGFPRDRSATLRPHDNKELAIGPFTVTDDSLCIEHKIVLAVPRGDRYPEVNLAWLAGPGLRPRERGAERSSVEDLLELVAFRGNVRGMDVAPRSICASLLTWRTEWGNVQAPGEFPADASLVLRAGHGADLITQGAREAWQPASAQVRPRGGGATVYRRVADAVVVVRTRTGHGTGFLVGKNLVLTNHHVIATGFAYSRRGRPVVQVHRGDRDKDGWMHVREEAVPADVVLMDVAKDLALLRVRAPEEWFAKMSPIKFARSGRPRPAEDCYIVGHPASGMLWSLREGRVAKVGRMPQDLVDMMVKMLAVAENRRAEAREQMLALPEVKIVLTTCAGNPGDSGSPLLDGSGRLLGITYAIPSDVRMDKFVYHVHVDEIRSFLEREPEKGPAIPDAWRLGPVASLSKSSPGATQHDVIVAGTRRPEQVLIDVDGDTKDLRPDNLVEHVKRKTFDAEAVFHFLGDRRIAFYDTNNDGTFNLILIDNDDDPEADIRFRHAKGRWWVRIDVAMDWLKADYLKFKDGANLARPKFQMLVQP